MKNTKTNLFGTKAETLLTLSQLGFYRIIISTDHGFRHSSQIDRFNTFAAFYGFEKNDIERVKYVQDIGSLINHSFK